MGYTNFTVDLISKYIALEKPESVLDLGAQNMYNQPYLPAPYAKDWYLSQDIGYCAIDINGENGSYRIDLSKPFDESYETWILWVDGFSYVVDAGTSEHVSDNGVHGIEAIYNCWKTKHDLLKVSGVMINENPKSGNWPGHGQNYYTQAFYLKLAELSGYEILELGEHPAMGNITDGWNVYCILRKTREEFITLEEFKTCGIKLS